MRDTHEVRLPDGRRAAYADHGVGRFGVVGASGVGPYGWLPERTR